MRISMKESFNRAPVEIDGRPKKIANNTFEFHRNGSRFIRLHLTDIIEFRPDGSVILDTAGWQTVTTKERLNRYAPCQIFQEGGIWTLSYCGKEYTFADGVILRPDGSVEGAGDSPKAIKALRKRIKAYAKAFVVELRKGNVRQPNAGDCFHCLMKDSDGHRVLGGLDHILAHIDDEYYVPSLAINAINDFGASVAAKHNVACAMSDDTDDKLYFDASFVWDQIERCIRRHCYRECGLPS